MATDIKFESATLERVILAYLIKDKSFFLKIAQYLKTSDYKKKTYFIDGKLQWLLNFCCKYYDVYEKVPSLETVKITIEKATQTGQFDPLLAKAIRTAVEEIYNKPIEEIEPEYIKDETVKNAFQRMNNLSPEFEPFLPCDNICGYRNKAQYPVAKINGKAVCGFYSPRSHRVIPLESCMPLYRIISETVTS